MNKRRVLLFVSLFIAFLLSGCGKSSKENLPDISGKYSFGNHYLVELAKSENTSEDYSYSFSVCFDFSTNDYIVGEMNLDEPYSFDDTNSFDVGELTFSYEDNKLYLSFESELHGQIYEELVVWEELDYTTLDLDIYCKEYYSPTEMYGISLLPDEMSGGFYVSLDYSAGLHDEGVVIPGEETTLVNGAIMTLEPQADGGMYITLYSAIGADGNFKEYLIEGSLFDIIGIAPSMLGQLDFGEAFSHFCEIEKNCINMDATAVIDNPWAYCNDTTYRFTGEVVWCGDTSFLLQITDDLENNLISCYNTSGNVWVSEGNKICVYGKGIGEDTYTRTFYDGSVQEYTTLAFDVGYVLYQEEQYYNFTNNIDMYPSVKNLIYGTYECSGSTPYLLEREITIDENTINGRPYTVDSIYIDFAATSMTTSLADKVYIELNVLSTSKHSDDLGITDEYPMSFQFALDGSGCNFGATWFDQTSYSPAFDYALYVKTS